MLPKYVHEIRDPIHVFIRLISDERQVVDSPAFQRLRHIHQLALSYLVYPGATHKRFEHALGTMELATKVFDIVTNPSNLHERARSLIPEISQSEAQLGYWRQVLRMAALCHDIGHLPFSHAAEKDLLPEGWNHERITVEIIKSAEMREIWDGMIPPLHANHIAKIAVGKKKLPDEEYTLWEAILSEIIVSDAFGVDRIDYLLRDSHHAGVGYGKFDHHRLLDTMMILPTTQESDELDLGVQMGGLHSAEALLLARYFMYTQVYYHHIRRIYDRHLIEFLRSSLCEGKFPTSHKEMLRHNDVTVLNAMIEANADSSKAGSVHARRIIRREHFKRVYSKNPAAIANNLDIVKTICDGLKERYGQENVIRDSLEPKSESLHFPVLDHQDRIVSSDFLSSVLRRIPEAEFDSIYVHPDKEADASKWLESNIEELLRQSSEEEK